MRKRIIFITLLIVITGLLTSVSAQESVSADNSVFLGLWVDTDYSLSSDYQYITAIAVRKNGKAFFVSDKFYDFPYDLLPDNRIYLWEAEGNKLSLISSDTGKVFWELYLFETDQRYLSFNKDGKTVRFEHVPHIPVTVENTTDTVFPAMTEDSKNQDIVGMWSFYWDAKDLYVMNFDCRAYNLYLFDDGKAYMTNLTVKYGVPDFSRGALYGDWTRNDNEILISIGKNEWRSWLDESGRLFVQMSDDMALIFQKVAYYNYEEGIIN